MRGDRIQIPIKAEHHRWSADNGPILNAEMVALGIFRESGPVLIGIPLLLRFSSGGRSGPNVPALDPRMHSNTRKRYITGTTTESEINTKPQHAERKCSKNT